MRIPTLLVFVVACNPPSEVTGEGRNPGECSDGADNDGDGLFDCADSGCFGAPACDGVDGGTTGAIKWHPQVSNVTGFLTAIMGGPSGGGCFGHIWAVGENGTIVTSLDGATWSVQSSNTSQSLYGVWCGGSSGPSPLAVGDKGTIVQWVPTSPTSGNWAARTSGTTAWLRAVWGSTSGAFAVGHQGVVVHTSDGGTTSYWNWPGTAFSTSANFRGVYGLFDGDATIVGSDTTGSVSYSQSGPTTFLKTSMPSSGFIYAIGGSHNGGEMIAVGEAGLILRDDFGWPAMVSPTTKTLRAVWGSEAVVIAVGHGGTILRSVDYGSHWTVEPSGTSEDLYAVWGRSADDIYAVGAHGTILHYTP